ncbi:hypothetical protein N0V94_006016 [Neodidymelliopsis sp. IMI 364377]|nr:hypothetical protein N0V94_006016 [Neodidymelliopsis sp. IMI 364377]
MTDSITAQDNSDPVSYTCICPAQSEGGSVLLFYRYWANAPVLPSDHTLKTLDSQNLAEFHRQLASELNIGGKFRIAAEGFNITLGGTTTAIAAYVEACRTHWSFAGIDLFTQEACNAYFKPTPGCACAFNATASVRVTAEITPLGITNYAPSSWTNVISLAPADFHDLCQKGEIPLIDVRNHYESRIGYFVTGDGTVAVRPAVRRFSQWPGYVVRHVLGNDVYKKPSGVATYCTGGIRCEKGARWMQEALAKDGGVSDAPVKSRLGGKSLKTASSKGPITFSMLEVQLELKRQSQHVMDAESQKIVSASVRQLGVTWSSWFVNHVSRKAIYTAVKIVVRWSLRNKA